MSPNCGDSSGTQTDSHPFFAYTGAGDVDEDGQDTAGAAFGDAHMRDGSADRAEAAGPEQLPGGGDGSSGASPLHVHKVRTCMRRVRAYAWHVCSGDSFHLRMC